MLQVRLVLKGLLVSQEPPGPLVHKGPRASRDRLVLKVRPESQVLRGRQVHKDRLASPAQLDRPVRRVARESLEPRVLRVLLE